MAIIEDFVEFGSSLKEMSPIFALDFGDKTIGIATSDIFRNIATPLETIRRTKFTADAERLLELAKQRQVTGFVLGLPRNMDGSEGVRCQKTRAFARNLERLTEINIAFWDERLSTVAAERALIEADTSRAKRAQIIDHVAAGYILQGALDRLAHLP
ncbi:MAG: Holliday junction resolvase RuvX [Paracoccaceae bacterium]|nr:hypothetical protein RB2150_04693 [Rhodobacterales bacterium HTCC2150] [Rhodobacteraceae bacterium HTCC2150]MDG1529890.1 Holliday junction resolvase RuvX [Paracoccaceae bacterium]